MAAHGVCVRICFLPIVALAAGWRLGAAEPLGVAVAGGTFWVDERPVASHATVHGGNWIRAADSALELRLFAGARLRLAAGSRAQVHAERLVLEQGAGQILPGPQYTFEARGLRVQADAGARGTIALLGERAVEVAAEEGALRVMRDPRPLVAVVRAGMALRFEVQAPAGAQLPFEMTGCLERRDNRYVMRDLVTGILIEVRGRGLDREVGNVVEVTAVSLPGAQPAPGAQEVVQIRRLSRQRRGCPPAPGVAPAPPKPEAPPTPPAQPVPEAKPTPPAPAPRRGMSGAAKAVIAGVVIGGAGAGAAVFLIQRKKETISP
jgi:hypothetical protein